MFSNRIDEQEANDQKISAAATPEEELELTSTSFEAWDTLLSEMYDYLATVLNADQYASRKPAYKTWVEERDKGRRKRRRPERGRDCGPARRGQLQAELYQRRAATSCST